MITYSVCDSEGHIGTISGPMDFDAIWGMLLYDTQDDCVSVHRLAWDHKDGGLRHLDSRMVDTYRLSSSGELEHI